MFKKPGPLAPRETCSLAEMTPMTFRWTNQTIYCMEVSWSVTKVETLLICKRIESLKDEKLEH